MHRVYLLLPQFGYTWFAWIYTDMATMQTIDCVEVRQLQKVKSNILKYATNRFEN